MKYGLIFQDDFDRLWILCTDNEEDAKANQNLFDALEEFENRIFHSETFKERKALQRDLLKKSEELPSKIKGKIIRHPIGKLPKNDPFTMLEKDKVLNMDGVGEIKFIHNGWYLPPSCGLEYGK